MFGLDGDIWSVLGEVILAPLASLVILPLLSGIVGFNQRQQREKAAQELRLDADLARGLAELADKAKDDETRARLNRMHDSAFSDFMEKAQAHFEEQKELEKRPDKRYVILPKPRGFFGVLWSIGAVFWFMMSALFIAALATVQMDPADGTAEMVGQVIGMLIVVAFPIGVMMFFRWLAFLSARRAGRRDDRRAQAQAQPA